MGVVGVGECATQGGDEVEEVGSNINLMVYDGQQYYHDY